MTKIYFFIFIFTFLIYFSSATTLTISPPQIDFIGDTEEIICQKINIETEGNVVLVGKTQWAEKEYNERKLSKHYLNSEEIGIKIKFPELINIENNSDIEICIEGSNEGTYHGALLYKIENKPIQVGIWMNVSLERNNLIKITGNFINVKEEENILFSLSLILFVIFISLVILYKRKN
jgi:hypothetical protein